MAHPVHAAPLRRPPVPSPAPCTPPDDGTYAPPCTHRHSKHRGTTTSKRRCSGARGGLGEGPARTAPVSTLSQVTGSIMHRSTTCRRSAGTCQGQSHHTSYAKVTRCRSHTHTHAAGPLTCANTAAASCAPAGSSNAALGSWAAPCCNHRRPNSTKSPNVPPQHPTHTLWS